MVQGAKHSLRRLVIAGVTRIVLRTRRPQQQDAAAFREFGDQHGVALKRPLLRRTARADVDGDKRAGAERLLQLRALLRIGEHAHRPGLAADTERPAQFERALDFMQAGRERRRRGDDTPGFQAARQF